MQCKIFLFFFQIVIFCNEYNSTTAKPLIGQNVIRANAEEFKYVVCFSKLVDLPNPSNIICTGTLISRSIVLTAEHCFDNVPEEGLEVRVGSTDLRLTQKHLLSWWLTYMGWLTKNHWARHLIRNDIALTKLTKPVGNSIIPAVTTLLQNKYFYGSEAVVVGWGRSNTDQMSMFMQTANVTIISKEACSDIAKRLDRRRNSVTYGELCSIGNPYAILEMGDGGGPIIRFNTIVGVNIGKFPNLNDFNPEVANLHSSVYYYRDFIDDVLQTTI